jgi:serralysin
MCDRCALTQNFDPVRHKGEPFGAQYQESLDAASSVSTSYTIQSGDIFRGNIQSSTDEDWVRLTLTSGERYELLLEGQDGGGGTLPDPILTLRDASGNLISTNDDFTNRDSALSFTADSGVYYAQASAFGGGVGSYRLTLNQVSAPDLDEDFVDAAAGITTFYTIDVGETFTGDISSGVDEDWVRVILTEGQSYTIGVSGVDGGGGTLSDPYLKVYDATSTLQGSDDDGGGGFDSQLTFTAGSSGIYYIAASGLGGGIGTYTISITESNAPEPDPGDPGTGEGGVASYDQLARYLTEGYWEDDGRSSRSFSTSFDNVITVDITGLNADGRQLARWAFEAWEMVADIEFSEASFGADIDFNEWDSGA